MPADITIPQLALQLRLAIAEDQVNDAITAALTYIHGAAIAMVEDHAPSAPVVIQNVAVIRACGWLYEADPAQTLTGTVNILRASGAAAVLSAWREHRAGSLEPPAPLTPPAGGSIPSPPGAGNYILVSDNGALSWVEFPAPS